MKNFAYISFLLLGILWCFTAVPVNCQPVETATANETWVPALGNNFDKALFKGSLDISKHHLTGLLFIKQTSDTSFRFIFTNEMGMKFFDLEFIHEEFIIHYCFPSLSKKTLMKIVESDFRLLLPWNLSGQTTTRIITRDNEKSKYKVKSKGGKYVYTIENESRRIIQIFSAGKLLQKTRVFFIQDGKTVPSKIRIVNPTIKLTLSLKLLDK